PSWPVALLSLSAALEIALALMMRSRMRNSAANPFAVGMALAAFWAINLALDLGTADFGEKLLLLKLRSSLLTFYALVWFEAVYRFVYGRKCLYGLRAVGAAAIPAATAVLCWWPNPPAFLAFRHDYWIDQSASFPVLRFTFGPWAAVFLAYTLVVVAVMFAVLWNSLRRGSWDRTGRLLFLAAWVVGGAVNLAFFTGHSPTPGVNYAPIVSPLTFGLMALAMVRGRILRLAPVARAMLIENLEDLLVVLDATGAVIDLNRSAAANLGWLPESAQGRAYDEVLADWPGVVALLEEEAPEKSEVLIGGKVHELTVAPIHDPKGRLQARILILRDITDRKEIESQFQRAKEQAEAANAAKSRFLAMISHEIRTPMNAVVGFTHLLQSTPINDEQRQYLDLITQGGKALLVIIDDVLDYTKITSGRLDLEEAPFRVADQASHIFRLLQPRAREKGISLELTIDPEIPTMVVGDSVRVGQVLTNLVSNAIKFTERGGVLIRLGRNEGPEGERFLVAEIRDTGIGIAPEAMKRIFQPFSQADNSITRKYGGTGLGLAISKRLCELMGGELTVASEVGRGTTFTARMRVARASELSVTPEPAPVAAGRPLNLLVFEDNRLNQHVIGALLKKSGHRVRFAAAGQEGLTILEHESFDAVLMDIEMPGMDGYETVRRLREGEASATARNHIIAVTAHAMVGMREKCLAAGMDDFLTKPIDPAALREALTRCPVR
ncbi:MAG TPA: ATP-binding protein, partial [Opitutaceae bacterium]|nr:ATP-binding protein [Opitutaceae bacterium]